MIFTGHAPLTIDAKFRLAIPAKQRALLVPERDGNAFYTVPWKHQRLLIFTEASFIALTRARAQSLAPSEDAEEGEPDYFGMADRSELDSAGRIAIPKFQLELTGLRSDVMLVGAGQRMELWDRETWEQGMAERFKRLPSTMRRTESKPDAGAATRKE
jgi:MraZ protein